MTPGRLLRLLLLALPLVAGLHGGFPGWAATPDETAGKATASIHSPHQSLPTPVHNEATCAFCQAAIFPPHIGTASPVVPVAPEMVEHEVLSFEERIPHSTDGRAPSSRAPPTLRCA